MSSDARTSRLLILVMVVCAPSTPALAQASTSEPMSGWALGASAGLWGRLAAGPSDNKTANVALDASIERRISRTSEGGRAIRVQMGWGQGNGPGFEYTRVMIGSVRHLWRSRDHSGLEYAVYVAGGGGVYRVMRMNVESDLADRSQSRGNRPSAFAAIGADGWVFGNGGATLRGEYQLFSVGRRIYGAMGLGVQLHFR